jgi:NAD(P)-dependent dehydrogenase (short-subunit alcohol dehydrogenase family)
MLTGKVIFVTDAKGGLGNFVTQAFLDAGIVVGTARSIEDADFPHPKFAALQSDIHSREHARALVEKIMERWNHIDVLVHLVGGFAGGQPVHETDNATFERMFATNVNHIASVVLPVMQRQKEGIVLAIGSRTAMEPTGSAKAALVSLVRTIALENVILPGTMDTSANRAVMPDQDSSKWVQTQQVASTLVHLASTPNVTGAVIPIYGGEL